MTSPETGPRDGAVDVRVDVLVVGALHRWRHRVAHPRPGERLPDARVPDDPTRWFLAGLTAPAFHLLLCGPPSAWDELALTRLTQRHGDLLRVHRVSRITRDITAHWGVRDTATLLARWLIS